MNTGKRGSSRRKGDRYQDCTALLLALELYQDEGEYALQVEYEQAGNLDDIVIIEGENVDAYQVKYAVDPHGIYTLEDLTNEDSRVFWGKFADGWKRLTATHATKSVTSHLYTNRSLDKDLAKVLTREGRFEQGFVENRVRTRKREIRKELQVASGLGNEDFKSFLTSFRFQVGRRSLPELEQHIKGTVLDHQLGIGTDRVFNDLMRRVEDAAMERRDPISREWLDDYFSQLNQRRTLPQEFAVDYARYVSNESLKRELTQKVSQADGDYIILSGVPGSGKSTSLTAFARELDKTDGYAVLRYYCFVDINDNYQRQRIEAQSLWENILQALQHRYSSLLTRRFDYGPIHFNQVLERLGEHFTEQGQKLIILIDGLDHAERLDTDIRDNIISALPKKLPDGVVVVIGTQELASWPPFLISSRQSPDKHITMPLFEEAHTRTYLMDNCNLTSLSEDHIGTLHRKSEGLPLYLRYVAELLSEADNIEKQITALPSLPSSHINAYYQELWHSIEEKDNSRHLMGLFALLRFPVVEDDVYTYQEAIPTVSFDRALQGVRHLLKRNATGELEVFHNSFREFVDKQLGAGQTDQIRKSILRRLQEEEGSDNWFSHVFRYAFETGEHEYVLNTVDTAFVDSAMLHYRPRQDVDDAIQWAIEAAGATSDLVSLSRLANLSSRHEDRDQNLNRHLLSRVLLQLGRDDAELKYTFSSPQQVWLTDLATCMEILQELANQGGLETGMELIRPFKDAFSDVELNRPLLQSYSAVLGIYSRSPQQALTWLSRFDSQRPSHEPTPQHTPEDIPHLEPFIENVVKHRSPDIVEELRNSVEPFGNEILRFLIIRNLAHHTRDTDQLSKDLLEYQARFQPERNLELAYCACQARLSEDLVRSLGGPLLTVPPSSPPEYLHRDNPILHDSRMLYATIAYEGSGGAILQAKGELRGIETWWSTYQLYLALVGECLGSHWKGSDADWYETACEAISTLEHIQPGKRERIIEQLDLCQDEIQDSLYLLTKSICEQYPQNIQEWCEQLGKLQRSKIFTTHYGSMESIENYTFELELYERLSSIQRLRPNLLGLLQNCDRKFRESTLLKGSSRSDHYLRLAYIAANIGHRDQAEEWLEHAVHTTLIYGYHKDITLYYLIDVMGLLNEVIPEGALERCIPILEMVDWMHHVTDEDETKYLTRDIFEEVTKASPRAGIDLLHSYRTRKAAWQVQDCIEEFIDSLNESDHEVLWALTEVFANHSSDGRHAKQVRHAKEAVIALAPDSEKVELRSRLDHHVKTNVSPRQWHSEEGADSSNEKSYTLGGVEYSGAEIQKQLSESLEAYRATLDRLREENDSFFESSLTDDALLSVINNATDQDTLNSATELVDGIDVWSRPELSIALGKRFLEYGETERGFNFLTQGSRPVAGYRGWKKARPALEAVTQRDKNRALNLLVEHSHKALRDGNAYGLSVYIASGLEILGEYDALATIFAEFTEHCTELFRTLPQSHDYSWLVNYSPTSPMDEEILRFIINQLDTVEIDQGDRITDALKELSIRRQDITIPLLLSYQDDTNLLREERIITALYMAAHSSPNTLKPFIGQLEGLLKAPNFKLRMMAIELVARIKASSTEGVETPTYDATIRDYSPRIIHTPFRLLSATPSHEFREFYQGHVSTKMLARMTKCCEVLGIEEVSVIARIESALKRAGWNEQDAQDQFVADWRGCVHPQGYPMVRVIPTFNTEVLTHFNQTIDEIARKTGVNEETLDTVWRILQPADPEYSQRNVHPRPGDIARLDVDDTDVWLAELEDMKEEVTTGEITDDWTPLFDRRVQAKDEKYNRPYEETIFTSSGLVRSKPTYGKGDVVSASSHILWLTINSHKESVTLDQARNKLMTDQSSPPPLARDLPILAYHANELFFYGFEEIASIPGYLINQYDLAFRNFDLYQKGEAVLRYEHWREGYIDESYSRSRLSHGTRLLIHKSLLAAILNDHRCSLAQSTMTRRSYRKSQHNQESDRTVKKESLRVLEAG